MDTDETMATKTVVDFAPAPEESHPPTLSVAALFNPSQFAPGKQADGEAGGRADYYCEIWKDMMETIPEPELPTLSEGQLPSEVHERQLTAHSKWERLAGEYPSSMKMGRRYSVCSSQIS